MLPFLKKSPAREGLVSLEVRTSTVGLSHAVRDAAGGVRLPICEQRAYEDPSELPAAVAAMVREHSLAGARCVCVLPPHQYSLRMLDAPDVEPQELASAARWLVKDLIEFPLEEAVIDHFEIPEQSSRGRQHRIYVVASRARIVEELAELVEGSGLVLDAVDITELALRNVSGLLPEDDHGLALVQLGPRSGRVVITQARSLYLTRPLESGFLTLQERAAFEPLAELPADDSDEMLEALALEIQRSLDYYESQLGQPPISTLVLAPLEEPVPELVAFLEKSLSANVRALDLNALLELPQPLPEREQAAGLAAVGGALREEPGAP